MLITALHFLRDLLLERLTAAMASDSQSLDDEGSANSTVGRSPEWVDRLVVSYRPIMIANRALVILAAAVCLTIVYLRFPVDDMSAAIGTFLLRAVIKGRVCQQDLVYVDEVGVYAKDDYNFNGDPNTSEAYISQVLGFWNWETGYVGKKPWKEISLTGRRSTSGGPKQGEAATN